MARYCDVTSDTTRSKIQDIPSIFFVQELLSAFQDKMLSKPTLRYIPQKRSLQLGDGELVEAWKNVASEYSSVS